MNGTMDYGRIRERMIQEQVIGRGIRNPRVIAAMRRVPRHLFVPEALRGQSYGDTALPIGEGQTITQPYMVAYLCSALGLRGEERVLEIGTGSGYQAAVLSHLVDRVYSVERIRFLLERARKSLEQIDCRNVVTKLFDGTYGWKEEGPFDAILVTAGAPSVPPPIIKQLKVGGTMVIPLGDRKSQRLTRIQRQPGRLIEEPLLDCQFVVLVGKFGWKKRGTEDSSAAIDY